MQTRLIHHNDGCFPISPKSPKCIQTCPRARQYNPSPNLIYINCSFFHPPSLHLAAVIRSSVCRYVRLPTTFSHAGIAGLETVRNNAFLLLRLAGLRLLRLTGLRLAIDVGCQHLWGYSFNVS
ncbi:hypothetical protein BC938DRAFT_473122 [Jimgerdemannia flammicorona]|uniref:Uncharacterized protein n=1 Tax=Jimgerdemannia flammicorona TaxID=994334 RepID=A0A433R0P2_9FUNG|nr:hypothetical protein BC938DRAFT_473122 [Jimgerdemannia flammicorona]